jgi:hypothetical protein
MTLSDDELAALESGQLRIGYFFRLDTDPVVRIWLGVGDIQPGINVLDAEGATYTGFGEISAIPELSQLINGAAERVEFTVSGVSGDILKIASGGDAQQVKSKRASVGFALFGPDWQLLGPIKWIRTYVADFLSIQQALTDDPAQPIVRTITLSCGSLLTARRRPSLSYFTNQDQQARHPGDLFCERTPIYANQFNKEWPRFS